MTSNDAQIDVLLRRFAGQSQTSPATEHLDADELNAFAEGSLPDAARARYVSHLVDCDNCRQSVSQLAISSGSVVKAEASRQGEVSGSAWWKRLSGFFPPLTLRYAAFAMVLIAAAGVVFLVMQRQREPNLIALNSKENRAPETAVKPAESESLAPQPSASPASATDGKPGLTNNAAPLSQATPTTDSGQIAKLDQPKTGVDSPFGLKSAKEADPVTNPAVAANKKAAEPAMTETTPSYAPPPPPAAEKRAETQTREQSNVGGLASASGPRKAEQPLDKLAERGRGGEAGKDVRNDDNESRAVTQQVARKRASDEKVKGPRRDQDIMAGNRNANEVGTADAAKPQSVMAPKSVSTEEKPPEMRSAGGRKFKRQGNAWVDAKFKSSMTLKSISRGSSEFEDLDSGLRSIAQQLGGEIIVVWKGKAYQIR